MKTNLDTLLDAFTTDACDLCAMEGDTREKRVYRDTETGCLFCLRCLVLAVMDVDEGEPRTIRLAA